MAALGLIYPTFAYSSVDPPQIVASSAALVALPPTYAAAPVGMDAALPPDPVLQLGSQDLTEMPVDPNAAPPPPVAAIVDPMAGIIPST